MEQFEQLGGTTRLVPIVKPIKLKQSTVTRGGTKSELVSELGESTLIQLNNCPSILRKCTSSYGP